MAYFLATGLEKMRGAIPFKDSIDDTIGQINRNTMTRVMGMWAVLSTFTQLIGENISCLSFKKFSRDFAQQFCWTQGMYTNRRAYNMPDQAPYPGIAPCVTYWNEETQKLVFPCSEELQYQDKVFHSWYQWVPFYFMAVAVAYYIPYLILKTTRLRRMKPLIVLLKDESVIDQQPKMVVKKVATWLYNEIVYPRYATTSRFGKFWHDYGLVFGVTTVKFLYFAIAIAHMLVTARMFKIGNWITYGVMFSMPSGPGYTQTHIKDVLFPKVVACRIVKWGPTGKEPETGMCTLALNVMNQYLFLVMWYLNVVIIFLNAISWFFTMFKFLNPGITHQWILNSAMMQQTKDFSEMFRDVGPSGQIMVAKLAENMNGYMLSMVSSKVVRKMNNLNKRRCSKQPQEFYRMNGQPQDVPIQPLMEQATLAFGMMPQCMPMGHTTMPGFTNNVARPRSRTVS